MKYEITLTLRPAMYRFSNKEQHDRCYVPLLECLRGYKVSILVDLTQEFNVHYHGVIELRDLKDKDKLLQRFRKYNTMFGKKNVVQLQFENSWIDYLTKKNWVKEILGDIVIKDDFKIFEDLMCYKLETLTSHQIDQLFDFCAATLMDSEAG